MSANQVTIGREPTLRSELIVEFAHESQIAVSRLFKLFGPCFDVAERLLLDRSCCTLLVSYGTMKDECERTLSLTNLSKADVQFLDASSTCSCFPQFCASVLASCTDQHA